MRILVLGALVTAASIAAQSPPASRHDAASVRHALAAAMDRAGDRAGAWRSMIEDAPADQERGARYLVAHMPQHDLATLDPEVLAQEIERAHRAWRDAPWAEQVPEEVFLDAILPYAHVTEERAFSRAGFRERFAARVADCTNPGEAALRLNASIFGELGVRYSRERERADQNARQSIASGIASCTGLSIVLADACRSVGVPARLAGIRSWPHKRGNHTWVEVWDGQDWRFIGAAEPDPKGLDHTWFLADVADAEPGSRDHGVWAAVWGATGDTFPAAWARDSAIPAVDSTTRYVRGDEPAAETGRLMVVVFDGKTNRRVAAEVTVVEDGAEGEPQRFAGTSHDESHDGNDHLTFEVPMNRAWSVAVARGSLVAERTYRCDGTGHGTVTLWLEDPIDDLRPKIEAWYGAAAGETPTFTSEENALLVRHGPRARAVAWDAFLNAPIHDGLFADAAAKIVRTGDRTSEYTVKEVGARPDDGWGLVIAMHGGGGVPKRVNDSQWRHMQVYYKDHPEAGGYLYVALRAPNDTWNGFYDTSIAPLIERLIRQFVVCAGVDPAKVVALGYSHGGYGAFAIGPKIPDRFAAVHASASAPTDGITAAENLRHLTFSFMVGEKDTAYGRAERCQAFDARVRELREARGGGYPVTFDYVLGNGHGGLPDRDLLAKLVPLRRPALPATLSWRPTGPEVQAFYWLRSAAPDGLVHASIEDNQLTLEGASGPLSVLIDDRLVDLSKPLVVHDGEKVVEHALSPAWPTLLQSIVERADPGLSGTCALTVRRS